MFEKFCFYPGIITYNSYDVISDEDITSDNNNLTEDMFQVKYPKDYTLDVGWYGGIQKFLVYVINNFDWENPMFRLECSSLKELDYAVLESIDLINSKILVQSYSETTLIDKLETTLLGASGFLLKLRMLDGFDEQKFSELCDLLEACEENWKRQGYLPKRLAGILLEICPALLMNIDNEVYCKNDITWNEKIWDAYEKIYSLIVSIFN